MSMSTALTTIGGWFVSAAIQTLVDQVSSHALQQWGSQSGLEDGLEKLRITLLKIQPVISTAERRIQTKPKGLVQLLRELKDAAYDADDLIDEFEYQRLKQKVEASEPLPSLGKRKRFEDAANQVSGFLSSQLNNAMGHFTSDFDVDKPCSSSDDATTRINMIVERLESISDGVRDTLKLLELDYDGWKQSKPTNRRVTTSISNESRVYGRDNEREKIIEMLLEPGDEFRSSTSNVSVVSVVGIGGVGKTALAQYVYNDERVKECFQLRVWICVSDNFDVIRIMKEIIVSVSDERPHDLHQVTSLDYLQRILMENLMGKRLLLVLDDVWNVKWKTLLPPLEAGEKGSKVLATSREEKVVSLMSMAKKIFLGGLASDDYWSLFKKCAFGDENADEHQKLQWIGKQIAEKLKGSPLAAKTVGGLLNTSLDDDHWTSILKSGVWKLRQGEDDILPVLRLSYQHLPEHLQRCFAYCAVFPNDYNFDKGDLIHMWMAQGFIPQEGKERMEDLGKVYFEDLLCRSFFQLSDTVYVMHDLLHDLALSVSMDECFIIEGDELGEIPKTVRHLSLKKGIEHLTEFKNVCEFKNLKTLLILGHEIDLGNVLQELVKELKSIRVLVLESIYMKELLGTVGDLIHLRYLDLHATYIRTLPESLSRLYHLQVLKTSKYGITSFPESIVNLINLRHFSHYSTQRFNIAGIGKLTSLQQLKSFAVEKKSGHDIRQLGDMRELRELWIDNLENVESEEESLEAKLINKRHLAELLLNWGSERNGRSDVDIVEERVLEGLKPYPSLKRLMIECYLGVKSPTWMVNSWLSNLESIHLIKCRGWEVLPPLGQLPFLKVLHMKAMDAVKQIDYTFYGSGDVKGFPSLEKLHFSSVPNWEEWYGVDDCHLFTHLCKLETLDCPRLRSFPKVGTISFERMPQSPSLASSSSSSLEKLTIRDHVREGPQHLIALKIFSVKNCPKLVMPGEGEHGRLPSSLVKLCISKCGDLINSMKLLSSCIQNLTFLSTLEISDCPQLTSAKVLSHLTALQYLRICNCEELKSLSGLQALACLRKLIIEGCPSAYLMEDESLPSSTITLKIKSCDDLEKSLPGCLQNLTSLNKLVIQDTSQMTSFPSEKELYHLTALQDLLIRNCEALMSLGGLQALISLRRLTIEECPKLTVVSFPPEEEGECLRSLDYLVINNTSLLRVPPIRKSLTSIRFLLIGNCLQFTLSTGEEWLRKLNSLKFLFLYNCQNLQSLPAELQSLSSLKALEISDCPEIQSLPDIGMPMSLHRLRISGSHPMLKKRCQEGGADWDKIAHIPSVDVDEE